MSLEITEYNYNDFKSEGVSLLDIHAVWCGPCKIISPIIDQISQERPNIKVGKMDADENKDLVARLGIRSIPTILVFKDGEVVERKVGSITKLEIESMLDKHI